MKAVSPLVGFVLTIFITIMITTLTFTVIKPTLERNRGFNVINEASVNLELLSSAINEVATEAEGSKRTITLSVSDGEYLIDKNSNNIIFTFEPSVDLGVIGRIADKFLEKGLAFFDFFNNYLDNSLPKNLINVSGSWRVYNNRLEGINGTAYYFIDKILNGFYVSSNFGSDNNLGEIFVSPVNLSNLVLYLTFDEGNGNIVYDYSGNGNNGIFYGRNATNTTVLQLTGSNPINLTHEITLGNIPTSNAKLYIEFVNNTVNLAYNTTRVFLNGNLIGSFNNNGASGTQYYTFTGLTLIANAVNKITYEGNVTNITKSTVEHTEQWVDGKYAKSLNFDGVNDYVYVGNGKVNIGTKSTTYEVWVKPLIKGTRMTIARGWPGSSPRLFVDTDNSLIWVHDDISGVQRSISVSDFATTYLNKWVHIVATLEYDSINNRTTMKIFLDGVKKTENSWSGEPNKLYITEIGMFGGAYYWNGIIDEVRIYNKALSEEEIKFLYQEGLKKLQNSGMIQFNSQIKPYIAISNPSGKIYVENLRVGNQNSKEIKLIKPFYDLEFDSSFRFSKGNHQIKVENIGFNSTSKRPIIRINEE